jgi:hypothetical protein
MRLAEYHGKLATELTLGTGRTTAAGAGELVKRAKTSQRKLTEVEQDLRQAPGASQPQTRTIITQQLAGIGNTEQRFDPILQSDEQKLRRYKEYASGPLDSAARSRIDKAEEAAYKVKTKLGPAAYAALERGDTAYSNAPVYRKAVDARVYAVDPASRPPQTLDQAQSAGMEMGLERTLNT